MSRRSRRGETCSRGSSSHRYQVTERAGWLMERVVGLQETKRQLAGRGGPRAQCEFKLFASSGQLEGRLARCRELQCDHPAIANAVVDALSHLVVTHIDIPITPEKVWKILHENGVGVAKGQADRRASNWRQESCA